jgi:L-alanine-DL-glutamate epimerase-like enolase superfamily enzyme
MKIRAIEAVPFVLPYAKPFHMASGEVTEAAHVLIRVRTDEGLDGVAEAVSRPMIYGESQESIVAAVRRWFEPALLGTDPFDVERLQGVLGAVAANETVKGALDMALHDIRGKAAGLPTWHLLGAAARSLRVTRMLGMGSPQAVVDEAAEAAERHGITSFKVKIDNDVETGVRLLGALRERLGADAVLYVDANQSLTLDNALEILPRIEPFGISLLEEPVPADDVVARARIAAATRVPILADESARSVEEAGRQITSGSARAISIKTARTGYTRSTRIIGLAQGLHARTVIGSQGDSALGAITSATFGAAFAATSAEPAELDYFLGLRDQIVANVPVISGGRIGIDETVTGNGVRLDEDKLAHYRTDHDS